MNTYASDAYTHMTQLKDKVSVSTPNKIFFAILVQFAIFATNFLHEVFS